MPAMSDEPFTLVIFGASGDLTRRKLVPALWSLYAGAHLARAVRDHRQRAQRGDRRRVSPPHARRRARVCARQAAVGQCLGSLRGIAVLRQRRPGQSGALRLARARAAGHREGPPRARESPLLSRDAPSLYEASSRTSAPPAWRARRGWTRIIVEKPFGHDYESARTLNSRLGQVFLEEQIYRIDHYLGKETVQNLLVLRFANGIFEPLWNRSHVAEVQITVAETIGVETRGAYYEEAGALRRHDAESPAPAAVPHRARAAGDLRRRPGPRREEQGHARHPADRPAQGRRGRAPRPVRSRIRRRQAGTGLPAGERGRAGLEDRDVRGPAAHGRQLALGGRALLSAHGQASGQTRERDRDPLPPHPAHDLPPRPGRRRRSQ